MESVLVFQVICPGSLQLSSVVLWNWSGVYGCRAGCQQQNCGEDSHRQDDKLLRVDEGERRRLQAE